MAESFEQRVVLHAARAYLHDVGILGDEVDIFFAHHFSDDGEASEFARLAQNLEAFHSQALKRVRR